MSRQLPCALRLLPAAEHDTCETGSRQEARGACPALRGLPPLASVVLGALRAGSLSCLAPSQRGMGAAHTGSPEREPCGATCAGHEEMEVR